MISWVWAALFWKSIYLSRQMIRFGGMSVWMSYEKEETFGLHVVIGRESRRWKSKIHDRSWSFFWSTSLRVDVLQN